VAVNNLDFRAYRGITRILEYTGYFYNAYLVVSGQITVLLGHNGAGKSTTFSVISGVANSSGGEVYICRESIRENVASCQNCIGYCPQYNPLFARLTVREHLRFYARLKGHGADGSASKLDDDIDALARAVHLTPKLDVVGFEKEVLRQAREKRNGSDGPEPEWWNEKEVMRGYGPYR